MSCLFLSGPPSRPPVPTQCSIADCLPFYTAMLNLLLIGSQNRWHKWDPGGKCQNFDRDACPIFLGLKFGQILFFWVGKFFSYFSGFRKISAIFLDLTNFQLFFGSSYFCITHLNPLNEEHAVLKNIKS